MSYVLGLDLGTNSIGWACIDPNSKKVLGIGSRIFPEGVDRDKGKEISKNATRRDARQSRRQYFRTHQRKEQLKEILLKHGMFPKNSKDLKIFFSLGNNKPGESSANKKLYELRKKAIYQKLEKLELGRVFYHLNQRRGFKSSRKSGDSKESGKVAEQTTELQKKIEEAQCQTLGEYFASLNPIEQRIRNRYLLRSMLEAEFEKIWEKQKLFHPFLTDELKQEIHTKTIFYQRPLKSQHKLIGLCSLEPRKKRAPKETFLAQYFRILEQVNRLEMIDEDGVVHLFSRKRDETFEPEFAEMRMHLINELNTTDKLDFPKIRNKLGVSKSTKFNLEEKQKLKHLKGNQTAKKLSLIFKDWKKLSKEEKEKRHQVIHFAQDSEWLKQYAENKWGLPPDKAKRLAYKTHFESGYMHYSRKALRKIIPYLESGLNLSDARIEAGYIEDKRDKNVLEKIKNLRNPIVQQTLYELLRLLKNIEKEYGRPEKIQVELTRNLKASAEKRKEIFFENLKNKEENERIDERLEEKGIKPTGDARLRYKLWEECKQICPYTGDPINFCDLFSDTPKFQIEHIIPYSRSLDDSFINKTLCRIDINQQKGNKTPWEFFSDNEDEWGSLIARIKELGLPSNKIKKFQRVTVEDGFIERQLNDTRYISRTAKEILESLNYPCSVTQGTATGILRYLWGLNTLISPDVKKNRADHRHHSLDAAVVAVTEPNVLHKLSAYNKYNREATREKFPEPWENFRESLRPHLEKMLISFRVNKRARGSLHEETLYGITGNQSEKGSPLYSVRKPLTDLKPPMIPKIADPHIRDIVIARLRENNINPGEKRDKFPKGIFDDLHMPSAKGKKIPIKKVRLHVVANNMIPLGKRNRTAVEPGGNHHIVLFHYKDGKGNIKQGGEICTMFEAVRRVKNKISLIRRNLEADKEFICSLAINEMVLLDITEDQVDWGSPDYGKLAQKLYRVQNVTVKNNLEYLTLRFHQESTLENKPITKTAGSFRGIKVRIDRLGKLYKAYD